MTAAAVIGGIDSLYKIGTGIFQGSKANKLEKKNKRPVFSIQDEYFNNQTLSSSMAQRGLTDKAINYYTTQAERGLSSSADTALQLGGNVNSINQFYDIYQRGLQDVAVKDAELQTSNIRYLIDRNKELASQKTQQWVINKYEPYKDTARAIAQMRSASSQNISTGISQAAGIASSIATYNQNEDLLEIARQGQGGALAPNVTPQQTVSTPLPSPNTVTERTLSSYDYDMMRLGYSTGNPNYKDMNVEDFYNLLYP